MNIPTPYDNIINALEAITGHIEGTFISTAIAPTNNLVSGPQRDTIRRAAAKLGGMVLND